MARLNEEGQWIIMMGFIISAGIFFLGILMNQSVLVGQTTAESVLEFPKSDIQDLRNEVRVIESRNSSNKDEIYQDISNISLYRKNTVINIGPKTSSVLARIHFNNGVTSYNESVIRWDF